MLGGPCSQHVMGNTSRQNQPQSAIMGVPKPNSEDTIHQSNAIGTFVFGD